MRHKNQLMMQLATGLLLLALLVAIGFMIVLVLA